MGKLRSYFTVSKLSVHFAGRALLAGGIAYAGYKIGTGLGEAGEKIRDGLQGLMMADGAGRDLLADGLEKLGKQVKETVSGVVLGDPNRTWREFVFGKPATESAASRTWTEFVQGKATAAPSHQAAATASDAALQTPNRTWAEYVFGKASATSRTDGTTSSSSSPS